MYITTPDKSSFGVGYKKAFEDTRFKGFSFLFGCNGLTRFCIRDEFASPRWVAQFAEGFFFNLAHALTREAIFVGYGLECPTGTIEAIVETDDVGFAIIQCVEQIVDFISQGIVKHFGIWWDLVFVVHQIDEGRIFVVNRFVQRKYAIGL